MPSPPPPPPPSSDLEKARAGQALQEATGERTAASNRRVLADGVRVEYESAHAAVLSLWTTVAAWCDEYERFIPPEVQAPYSEARQASARHAEQGVTHCTRAVADFYMGQFELEQAGQSYTDGDYAAATIGATHAFQSFQRAKNYWDSAYTDYARARDQAQQAYDLLAVWFQTVNP